MNRSHQISTPIILKIIWILASVFLLVVTLFRYTPDPANDIGIFFLCGMLFLSFPISLLGAGLVALISLLQDNLGVPLLDLISSNYAGYFLMWLLFTAAGYLQWFVLLPWLWRKWKSRNDAGHKE